jgi:hypothetical protein
MTDSHTAKGGRPIHDLPPRRLQGMMLQTSARDLAKAS